MNEHVFYIVDVFAESRYTGNQLAVFRNGNGYSDNEMQDIAKEMNYSETTFIISDEPRDGGYDVRIFTPAEEVPFAGHPTLGTAFIILREIVSRPLERIVLNLTVGQIPVTFDYRGDILDNIWMQQKPPQFGETLAREDMAAALGLDPDDIDASFPIQEVSTGLPFIIVPVKTLEAVKRARVRRERFFPLIEQREAKAPLLFCPVTYRDENDLNVRVFVDYYDIPEDPATGSANGCLAGYLVKHRFFGSDFIDIRVEQGYEIGRPSLLLLQSEEQDDEIAVRVGGKVIMVAEGRLSRE
jgi:trans-2,3-dihydro-3-hydroxyanthranilate isomerase